MSRKEPEYCFEFWKCPKETQEKCPACTLLPQKNCWAFGCAGHPKVKRDFDVCWDCPWFQRMAQEPHLPS